MALTIDPIGDEIRALKKAVNWRGKSVLEIGCGDGRLTRRLAGLSVERIAAFDPNAKSIRAARKNLPDHLKDKVQYRVGNAERMKQKADQFDIVVFSWSL